MKQYELDLPVFKRGDDLAHSIDVTTNFAEAFKHQSELYAEASRICKRMAGIALEHPDLDVYADTHLISLTGPTAVLEALEKDGVVLSMDWGDEEDEEGSGERFDVAEGEDEPEEGVEFNVATGDEPEDDFVF